MLNDLREFPLIKDTSGYLAVKLVMKPSTTSLVSKILSTKEVRYAIVEIPKTINRFVVLPSNNDSTALTPNLLANTLS